MARHGCGPRGGWAGTGQHRLLTPAGLVGSPGWVAATKPRSPRPGHRVLTPSGEGARCNLSLDTLGCDISGALSLSRCVRLVLGDATGAGLTWGSGLHPANPRAVTQPQGWNAKARTNLGRRCPVPGQTCHSGLFSRGHYFFLIQLNTSSGGCGEERQSQQEHVGSSALLWL